MAQVSRLLVFRSVPKPIAAYIQSKGDYRETPIRTYTNQVGDIDITLETNKDNYHTVREYVYGLIDGYLVAQQPEKTF